MPFYRYRCKECKNVFRVLQKNGGDPSPRCPECGSVKTERLLPRIGVIYKGNGYYTTDYGNRGKKSKTTTPSKTEG